MFQEIAYSSTYFPAAAATMNFFKNGLRCKLDMSYSLVRGCLPAERKTPCGKQPIKDTQQAPFRRAENY
jgi:hypothetical protein